MIIRSHALAALGALALASQGLACQSSAQAATPGAAPTAAVVADAPALAAVTPSGSPDFASVAERILPSVVSIHVEQQTEQSAAEGPEQGGPGWLLRQRPGFGPNFRMPTPGPRDEFRLSM